MTPAVQQAIESIRCVFEGANLSIEEDGAGGAYVIIDSVDIGNKYIPSSTWIGAHLSPQLPYADVYPLFIGADVARSDGSAFTAPITPGHNFRGRSAIQVSRRTNRLDPNLQTAASKFLKVIHWLKEMA